MRIEDFEKDGLTVLSVSKPITKGNVTCSKVKLYSPIEGEFTRTITCHSRTTQLDELYSLAKEKGIAK